MVLLDYYKSLNLFENFFKKDIRNGGEMLNKYPLTIGMLAFGVVLGACSDETVKDNNQDIQKEEQVEESKKEIKTKEYSFKGFRKLSQQEQQDIIVPIVSELGYNRDLAIELLRFINEDNSDLPKYYTSVNDYVTRYIESSDIPSYKLEKEGNEEEDELPIGIEVSDETSKKRAEVINGRPLFKISDTDQLTILGVGLGDSFSDIVDQFGEPDHINKVKQSGIVQEASHFVIKGDAISEGKNYYQFIIKYEDNGEFPDAISEIKLVINNKQGIKPSLHIPNQFSEDFQGEIFVHSPTNFVFTNSGKNFSINFLHNTGVTQTLELLSKSNDFTLTASVWGINDLEVWESNKVIYEPVTMEDADEVLNFEFLQKDSVN